MMALNRFNLIYAPQVKSHLKTIEKKYHSLIRRRIEVELRFEPHVVTPKPQTPKAAC